MKRRIIESGILICAILVTLLDVGFAQELNIAGSSSARNFATDVPLNLCNSSPLPIHYMSANGNLHVWVCNGGTRIFRYAATYSSDGYNKVIVPSGSLGGQAWFLDHTLTQGCVGPTPPITRPSDGKQYLAVIMCSDFNQILLPVHMGVSDVQGASFHQTGPVGSSITPIDDSSIYSVQTAIVPLSLFVGKGVVAVSPNGTPAGPISGLSRAQIETIFNRGVTDWQRLGLGTVTDAAPSTVEPTSPITLCLRYAGSGTKAAFDEIVMINNNETSVANASVIFSSSTSGVIDCLAQHRRSIGYMDADQVVSFTAPLSPNLGLAYPIRIDGGLANDPSLTDPKRDLKCGKYLFWTSLRLNRRTTSEGVGTDLLAQSFIDNAGAQATIGIIPTGAYWASDEEMAVFKNQDRGPISWKAGNHPECR